MVPVQQFGAVGDGVADDTAALRHAVEQCRGELYFPRGVYRLTQTLEIPLAEHGPLSIRGGGGAALRMEGAGPALRLIGTHQGSASPASVQPGVYARERMPTLDGLEIVGAHPEADGIEVRGVIKLNCHRLFVRECRDAIRLVVRNRDVLIDGCQLYNNRGCGLLLDQVNLHQINVVGCHISYNQAGGIKVVDSEVRNLQITGNDIEYNYGPNTRDAADLALLTGAESIREGTIASNTIQARPSPGGANVRFVGQSRDVAHKVGLFTITGNLISNQETVLHLKWARGVVVSGNCFYGGHQRGALVEESSNLVFSGNLWEHNPDYRGDTPDGMTFRDCAAVTVTGLHVDRARGETAALSFQRCEDLSITGCQLFDCSPAALELIDCRHALVSGNRIRDRREPPLMTMPLRIHGGADLVVRDNAGAD